MDESRRQGLFERFTQWLTEMNEQPPWRSRADRECDYYDGNQLDSEVMRRLREIGMPPAIEPLIGPTIDAVLGAEARSRTDWRVTPEYGNDQEDVVVAMNAKLNQAERYSRADDACSEAYASQIKVGVGWVEVARESDPFRYPFRCRAVHRNEIWWDFLAKQPDLSDARYLLRRMWVEREQAELMFPQQAELIRHAASGWQGLDPVLAGNDGGQATDLFASWALERGWSVEEQQWRDTGRRRVCLFELWYREWRRTLVLKGRNGEAEVFDADDARHLACLENGERELQSAVVPQVRLAWWLGPHCLSDAPSPYPHGHFPYVPFWGKREDRTAVPYGLVRGMMYLQDEVNARIAKMQWGLAAVRTIRTEGAALDDDERLRQEVARPDADIVLDLQHMQEGGVFRIERDFELNRQQYERLVDAREGIKRTGGIYNAFMGQDGSATSGVAIAGLVEQSNQSIADINDNFGAARRQVGELLLSLVLEDMAGRQETVFIDGQGIRESREVTLNRPVFDDSGAVARLENDISRLRLQVALQDVPATPSFRAQQLAVLGEAFKSAPPEYQRVMMPHLFTLMDVPNKLEMIGAIRETERQPGQEEVAQQISEAVNTALRDAGLFLEQERLALERAKIGQKQALVDAQVKREIGSAVRQAVESVLQAMDAASRMTPEPGERTALARQVLQSAVCSVDGGQEMRM